MATVQTSPVMKGYVIELNVYINPREQRGENEDITLRQAKICFHLFAS